MKFKILITLSLFILVGCTSMYKNPAGVETAEVYGSFHSWDSYKEFFKQQRKLTSLRERFTEPVVLLASIDGIEVNEPTIPARVTGGKHILRYRLHDTKEYADFLFSVDVELGRIYKANYSIEEIDGKFIVEMWVEDWKTKETLSNKEKKQMIPFSQLGVPIFL
jgi:major membrane immunogen (membrane-anchored lipoprotein)